MAFLLSCPLANDKQPIFDIPNIREYFMDLDFVLGFISDGPTKSFAFRRLQYLRGKFTMYTLLNEIQEMTEMKVCALPDMIRGCSKSISAGSSSVMQSLQTFFYPLTPDHPLAIFTTSARLIRTSTILAA